ncbi:Sas10 C-terminal domain-containing protein, putative [Babesia ovata]|uniref:Sas10 C-terminal domain-containing protein, putative n=1 Tax=Babesia ovata TaxID=189622 RepID=A0A2H6KBD2_9APIC|nr:Sas10 C-terminal domain-containing protein, putative [Babesia ovata]GBE60269.1 Sas10 C-terminal domain-containing protein, putative [Babesia ovata]
MARKTAKKASTKKFKGNEAFIPLAAVSENDDSDAAEFEAMALPRDLPDDDSEDELDDDEEDDEGDDDDDEDEDDGDEDEYGDDSDDGSDDEEEGTGKKKGAAWGKKLGTYYDEGSEESSDDEDINDRIAEAERIARDLYDGVDDEDAELEDMVEAEDEVDTETTALDSILEDLSASLRNQSSLVELPPDFYQLSDADKRKYLEDEHPEFMALLKEFKEKAEVTNEQVLKIVNDMGVSKKCTKDGMEYLDVRNELMLMYVTYLSYYLLLKTHGVPVENHPVINRLLEIRIMLDKARPIESRLQFEINKLLDDNVAKGLLLCSPKFSLNAAEGKALRPRLDLMEFDEREQSGIYKPPAQLPLAETDSYVSATCASLTSSQAKHQKKLQRKEKVVSGKRMLDEARDMQEDDEDEPTDRYSSAKAAKMVKALLERERYEMEQMRRLPMNKMAKKELREFQKHQRNKQGGIMLDELSSFAAEAMSSGQTKRDVLVGMNAAAQIMRQDILETEKLRASDAYFKPHVAKKSSKPKAGFAPMTEAPAPRKSEFDDEFSKMKRHQTELKESLKERKSEVKKRKFEREEVGGKRGAGADILRNKGLTRQRKKTAGNARVSNRMKYEKKKAVHSSKVSGTKTETPGYSGETTGINAKKKKSVTF